MNRPFGRSHYSSTRVKSVEQGYEGYELMRLVDGENVRVARIVYVEAAGHYYVEIFDNTPVPLEILEELIAETKEDVKFM